MATITISNPDLTANVKTFLSDDYSSGTSLSVDSSASFASGNYILVGEPGNEKSEVTNLTAAPSTSTLTITSINYPHPSGTPVYYLKWDKYQLSYQSTSGGAWSVYAGMPLGLAYDALQTEYRDASATSTYFWKYRYYSTENSTYSDYSDTISASGWPRNSAGYMVKQVRKIINDPENKQYPVLH